MQACALIKCIEFNEGHEKAATGTDGISTSAEGRSLGNVSTLSSLRFTAQATIQDQRVQKDK